MVNDRRIDTMQYAAKPGAADKVCPKVNARGRNVASNGGPGPSPPADQDGLGQRWRRSVARMERVARTLDHTLDFNERAARAPKLYVVVRAWNDGRLIKTGLREAR